MCKDPLERTPTAGYAVTLKNGSSECKATFQGRGSGSLSGPGLAFPKDACGEMQTSVDSSLSIPRNPALPPILGPPAREAEQPSSRVLAPDVQVLVPDCCSPNFHPLLQLRVTRGSPVMHPNQLPQFQGAGLQLPAPTAAMKAQLKARLSH